MAARPERTFQRGRSPWCRRRRGTVHFGTNRGELAADGRSDGEMLLR